VSGDGAVDLNTTYLKHLEEEQKAKAEELEKEKKDKEKDNIESDKQTPPEEKK